MNAPIVKICGLMRPEDICLCQQTGVNIIGMVTEYPLPVPWNLSAEKAAELMSLVQYPMQTCLVTGGTRNKILALAESLRPDYLQLHYQETIADADYIARQLANSPTRIIKTLPPTAEERQRQFGTAKLNECLRLLEESGVYAVLTDPRTAANASGSGFSADVETFVRIRQLCAKPVILAGGITPENVADIIAAAHPQMIDIMTGVESSPGIKDPQKVTALMSQCQSTTEQ